MPMEHVVGHYTHEVGRSGFKGEFAQGNHEYIGTHISVYIVFANRSSKLGTFQRSFWSPMLVDAG